MIDSLDIYAQKYEINKRPKNKPWITNDILQIFKSRNLAYNKFIYTKAIGDFNVYKYYRNLVVKEIMRTKKTVL